MHLCLATLRVTSVPTIHHPRLTHPIVIQIKPILPPLLIHPLPDIPLIFIPKPPGRPTSYKSSFDIPSLIKCMYMFVSLIYRYHWVDHFVFHFHPSDNHCRRYLCITLESLYKEIDDW